MGRDTEDQSREDLTIPAQIRLDSLVPFPFVGPGLASVTSQRQRAPMRDMSVALVVVKRWLNLNTETLARDDGNGCARRLRQPGDLILGV